MRSAFRLCLALFASALLLAAPLFPFDTHLSDEAIREAYFLGQHHDKSVADFLAKYMQFFDPPDSGPQIAYVAFYTPYAQVVQTSNGRSFGYSVQQAEQDHRHCDESVSIVIQILLTPTYGPTILRPTGSRSGASVGFVQRPGDFWKDFQVDVFNKDKHLIPLDSSGEPTFNCDSNGGCVLSGAILRLTFRAEAFTSDTAVIQINPPEGDPFSTEFDLGSFR